MNVRVESRQTEDLLLIANTFDWVTRFNLPQNSVYPPCNYILQNPEKLIFHALEVDILLAHLPRE